MKPQEDVELLKSMFSDMPLVNVGPEIQDIDAAFRDGGLISNSQADTWKGVANKLKKWKLISNNWRNKAHEVLNAFQEGGIVGQNESSLLPMDLELEGGSPVGGNNNYITINIEAPLIDDHITDVIIPKLDEALRRGETFTHLK